MSRCGFFTRAAERGWRPRIIARCWLGLGATRASMDDGVSAAPGDVDTLLVQLTARRVASVLGIALRATPGG